MSGYLLDTNVLSELVRKHPSPGVVERLEAVPAAQLHTSSVCVMELRFGTARRPNGATLWARIRRDVLGRVTILPLGIDEAVAAGEILADLERVGERIGVEDVLIAATARTKALTVVTRNVRHLSRVRDLGVEDWFAGA